jgi:hypothetical protein
MVLISKGKLAQVKTCGFANYRHRLGGNGDAERPKLVRLASKKTVIDLTTPSFAS